MASATNRISTGFSSVFSCCNSSINWSSIWRRPAAENPDQFLVDDADNLLGGREGLENFLPQRALPDVLDQLLDDFEIDVGLEQRHADLTQRRLHIFGRQASFAAQILEDTLQF